MQVAYAFWVRLPAHSGYGCVLWALQRHMLGITAIGGVTLTPPAADGLVRLDRAMRAL
jgi:hypothetical protein